MSQPIRAHIFTNIPVISDLVDGEATTINDVTFSCGYSVPENIDVLIVFTRASYSIQTRLPKERTVFTTGEPDVIHKYSTKYLNQFGLVRTASTCNLTTEKIHGNMCSPPFVGINFEDKKKSLSMDWFRALECSGDKDDKISVVTSTKAHTPYHKSRMAFVDTIIEKIPEHLRVYGVGRKHVADKKDAILPSKYHLALENGGGPFAWTEKLADPLLCWSLPFYHGADNIEVDLPAECVVPIDISQPDQAIEIMLNAIHSGLWAKRLDAIAEARQRIFTEHNLPAMFASLAKRAMEKAPTIDPNAPKRLIRSERSFLPEKGERGGFAQMLLRRGLTLIDPQFELRVAPLQARIEQRRAQRRARKHRAKEAQNE
jgi:hypothetical protein